MPEYSFHIRLFKVDCHMKITLPNFSFGLITLIIFRSSNVLIWLSDIFDFSLRNLKSHGSPIRVNRRFRRVFKLFLLRFYLGRKTKSSRELWNM